MKKILNLILGILLSFSCQEKEPELSPEIQISKQEILAAETGGSYVFHVKSNVNYSIKASESWVKISESGNQIGTQSIELTLEENKSNAARNALISIEAKAWSGQVLVSQSATPFFSLGTDKIDFPENKSTQNVKVEYDGKLEIDFEEEWLKVVLKENNLEISVEENINVFSKKGEIFLKLGETKKKIEVNQKGKEIYISPDKIGVEKDAVSLAKEIKLGWNLGNALEASSGEFTASETLWGNPKTSKELIDLVKKSGFNAIRLPIAWSGYIVDRTTHRVSDEWLNRVKEVVDYCVSNQMYVIVNMHWDGGWLENNPVFAKQKEILEKQKALWTQIAVLFRNYDEHLLFAGTNEVHFDYNTPTSEHLEVQMSFNQNFVNTVRATGGKNAYRNLVVQAYNTNITWALNHLILPQDATAKRTMVEVHFYDPYDFTIDTGTGFKAFWGKDFSGNSKISDWGQEAWVKEAFGKMKTQFVDKDIPVVLGEYGAMLRTSIDSKDFANHKKSRNYYLGFVTKTAKENGLLPFYWDNGVTTGNSMAIFNRKNNSVYDSEALNALQF